MNKGIFYGKGIGSSGQSWSANWDQLKTVTIDNALGSELTDFQVEVNLNSTNFDFTKVESDGRDIRFMDTDKSTSLSYYIESIDTGSETAKLFVKVPLISTSSSKIIYLLSGRAGSVAESSGENTFEFFDDFTKYTGVKDYFTNEATMYPMLPWNTESAQYFNGKTYIAFTGYKDDPYIISYTHATGVYSAPVKIGENPTLWDWHQEPSILIDSDGYIHVFWGAHNSAIKYSISNAPENITAFTARTDIDTDATYPQVFQKADGTIYLFYRRTTLTSLGYITSADSGVTWSAYTEVIDQRCYGNAKLGDDDKVHLVVANTTGTDAYGRHDPHYLYLDADASWKDIAGNVITLPYAYTGGTIVYDTAKSITDPMIKIVAGNPFIYFAEIDSANPNEHVYKFAKYSAGWVITDIVTTTLERPYIRGALDAISATEFHVYQMVGTKLELWKSIDAGGTWALDSVIMDDGKFYGDPILVFNGQADARVIIQEIGETLYDMGQKLYLYGSGGFCQNTITETIATPILNTYLKDANFLWKYKSGYLEAVGTIKSFVATCFALDYQLTSGDVIIETDVETSANSSFGIASNIQDTASTECYAAEIRGGYNDALIIGINLQQAYASWYDNPPGIVVTKAFTPSLNTRYKCKFSRLSNGDMIFDWVDDSISDNDATYANGRVGVYIDSHATSNVPFTTKFYYLRVRKNATVVPEITLT